MITNKVKLSSLFVKTTKAKFLDIYFLRKVQFLHIVN